MRGCLAVCALHFACGAPCKAEALIDGPRIHWAGFSFAGNASSVEKAYSNAYRVYSMAGDAATHESLLEQEIRTLVQGARPEHFALVSADQIKLGKGGALAMTCALDGEFIYVDRLSDFYNVSIWLSAEILVFDFNNRTLVASYPFGVILRTVSKDEPTSEFIGQCVQRMLLGKENNDNINLIEEFGRRLQHLQIREYYPVRLQLRHVELADKAQAKLPGSLRSDSAQIAAFRYFVGNSFAKALSGRADIPMLPYIAETAERNGIDRQATDAGHSMTILMGTVADGKVLSLKLPEPDYVFDLHLAGFRKAMVSEKPGIQKWVYAAYVDVQLSEPLKGTVYLKQQLVNPWNVDVPKGATVDDWGAYRSSLYELLGRFGEGLSSRPNLDWVGAQEGGRTLREQLKVAQAKLEQCR